MVYFDHNATAPLLPEARDAWVSANEQFPGNPSSPHRLGARAETALEQARSRFGRILGCDPHDVIWTSGATESNNLVLHHAARHAATGAEVWVSSIEHPSLLAPAAAWFPGNYRTLAVGADGVFDLKAFRRALQKRKPALVALMAVNNETGVLQPWSTVQTLCREHGVPFFCDAAQWLGKLPAAGLGGCDFVSGCAHKFGGPRGVGFLKVTGPLEPLIVGGPQEEQRRAGTENLAGVLSFVAALELREAALARGEHDGRLVMRQRFEKELLARVPGVRIVGGDALRLWNTVSAIMPLAQCEHRWVVRLDKRGFAVSTGSACASGKEEPSHVLRAMGFSAAESSRALRFSSGWETRESEWEELLGAVEDVWRGA